MTDRPAGEIAVISAIVTSDGATSRVEATLASLRHQTLPCPAVHVVGAVADAGPLPTDDAPAGEYTVLIRAGDILTPAALEKGVWALATRPRAGAVVLRPSRDVEAARVLDRSSLSAALAEADAPHAVMVRRQARMGAGAGDSLSPEGDGNGDLLLRIAGGGWSVVELTGDLVRTIDGVPLGGSTDVDVETASAHSTQGGLAGRWAAKLEAEGLADSGVALRHPFETLLRMLPQRMKGERWARMGLPVRPDPWRDEPPLLDLPDGTALPQRAAATVDDRLQVAVLHPYLIAGGAESLVLNLFTHIDRDRIELHLITTDPTHGAPGQSPWLARFEEQTESIFQLHGFLDPAFHLRFVSDFIASRDIEVVLISLSIFGYNALPQLRRLHPDVKFIDIVHAEAPYAPMDHIRLASLHRELLDRRVVTTESVRAAQIERYGEQRERVTVIPNGIDTAKAFNPERHARGAFRKKLGVSEDAAIVLFFGRLVDEKQPQHILEVAQRLRERSDIVFALVGAGPEHGTLERFVAERALKNVHVCAPEVDIAGALADAALTLFPSKREGLPMSGIESLSMGVPVVAARVPGWTDLVTDGADGILVAGGDFDGYVAAITGLIDDPDAMARMSEAGRLAAVSRYDVRTCVARWGDLLQQMGGRS